MAGRLETMLQPGEQVVYRARLGVSGFLKHLLAAQFAQAARGIEAVQWHDTAVLRLNPV